MDQLIRKNKIISTLNDGIDSLIDPEDKIEVVKDLKAYSHFKLDLLNSNNNNIVTDGNNVKMPTIDTSNNSIKVEDTDIDESKAWSGTCASETCAAEIMNTAHIKETYGNRKNILKRYSHMKRKPAAIGWVCLNCYKAINSDITLSYANIVAPSSSSPAKLRGAVVCNGSESMLAMSMKKSERNENLKRKNITQSKRIAGLTSETKRLKKMITQSQDKKGIYEILGEKISENMKEITNKINKKRDNRSKTTCQILGAITEGVKNLSKSEYVKVTGMSKHYYAKKNNLKEEVITGKIYDINRKERCDKFTSLYPEVVEKLYHYYLTTFSDASGHETVKQCRDEDGNNVSYHREGFCTDKCETKCRYNINETFKNGAADFNTNILPQIDTNCEKVSDEIFSHLAPWYLKPANYHTCVCAHHLKFDDATEALYHLANDCKCGNCKHMFEKYNIKNKEDLKSCIKNNILCEEKTYKCYNGTCELCGAESAEIIHEFQNCEKKSDVDVNDFKIINNSEGKRQKVRSTVTFAFQAFFIFFQGVLNVFFPHSFLAHQNAQAFQHDISHVQEGEAVLLMDFQMNLGHEYQQTIQIEHWAKTQTTIFPVIAYLKIGGKIVVHSYVVLSNDLTHDNAFVEHATALVMTDIHETLGYEIKKMTIWSDGCGSQFKNKNQFFKVSTSNIKVRHRFFASCHGKGPSDSEGAVVKHAVSEALRRGNRIYTSKKAYEYLEEFYKKLTHKHKVTEDKLNIITERHYNFVDFNDVNRPKKHVVAGLTGEVRKNHSFENGANAGVLNYSWACCSCDGCENKWHENGGDVTCKKIAVVGPVKSEHLKSTNVDTASPDDALAQRALKWKRKIQVDKLYYIRNHVENGKVGGNVKDPGVWLAKVLEKPRQAKLGDLVYKRYDKKKNKFIGESLAGKTNTDKHLVVKIRWFANDFDEESQQMIYQPEYLKSMSNLTKTLLKKRGDEYNETLIWFSHLRTHSDGNACQPLKQIFLPNQKKIKKKDRRFKINKRQYEKVCIQCNQDEDKYKKVTRSSYS